MMTTVMVITVFPSDDDGILLIDVSPVAASMGGELQRSESVVGDWMVWWMVGGC